jgi:hypothetical protein
MLMHCALPQILPTAKVPVTAERTSSNASCEDPVPAATPPVTSSAAASPSAPDSSAPLEPATEVQTQSPGPSPPFHLDAAAQPVAASDAKPTNAVADQQEVVVAVADSEPQSEKPADKERGAREIEDAEQLVVAADAKPSASVSAAPVPDAPAAPMVAAQGTATMDDTRCASGSDMAALDTATATPEIPKEVVQAERASTPAQPAQADSKHSPSVLVKHDEVALSGGSAAAAITTTTDDSAPAAAERNGVTNVEEQMPPVNTAPSAAATAADALQKEVVAVGAAADAGKEAEKLVKDDPAETSALCEEHVVVSTGVIAKEIEAVAVVEHDPLLDGPAPTAMKVPEVTTQRAATEQAAAADTQVKKPAEGGKHRRRGSFALFSCFRA